LGYAWRHRSGAKLTLAARVQKRPARAPLGRLAKEKSGSLRANNAPVALAAT
jgi:hypothetical protein